ncbi:MAG TPA: hypothetical protein PLP17_13655, partial [Oligoflexia bacterium]|nr:hypothetical protein [Oligoflexia bacterium]
HAEAFRFRPRFFFELLAGQAGLVGPLLFAGLCGALWAGYQRRRKSDLFVRYLLFMTLPLVFFVVAVSLTKRVYANWPMPVYVGALLLAAHLSAEDEVFRSRVRGWIAPAILLNLLITLAAHAVLFNINFGLPGNILPTKKLAGWQKLGEAVDRAIYTGRQSSADMFVMTDEYAPASAVSFYSAQHPFVYCTNTGRRRMNQYDVWIKPKDWAALRGKRALVVLKHAQDAEYLRMKFSAFLPAAPQPDLQFVHSGTKIREFFLFWGEDFDGSAPISPQAR